MTKHKQQWVWIIGAGLMQLPIIEAAKTRGYAVMITDRNPQAPGIARSDDFHQIDTYDVAGHLKLAERLSKAHRPIVACVADAIDVGHVSAASADYLGLTSLTYTVAKKLGSKVELRQALRLAQPIYLIGEPYIYAADLWQRWFKLCNIEELSCFHCVIKAADNCGTRGVSMVHDLDEFAFAVGLAQNNNHDDKRILVEEYLQIVEECASDWFVTRDHQVIQANGAKRWFDKEHFGIEIMYTNPWVAPEACQRLAEKLVERCGVKYGPIKIDFIRDARYGWCLAEAAGRWSGGFDHTHAYPLSTGGDLVSVVLDWALGNEIAEQRLRIPQEHQWACGMSPLYKPGKIADWQIPELAHTDHTKIINRGFTELVDPKDCGQRPIFIIADGDSEANAISHAQAIAEMVRPIYVA